MYRKSPKITIIAELSHQHGGDIDILKTMILQAKLGGADLAKIQLLSSQKMFGDNRKEYAEINCNDFAEVMDYSSKIGITLFPSVFDEERFWACENFLRCRYYKIASKVFENENLCNLIINSQRPVFISNGLNINDFRYTGKMVHYFYCVPEYPALLENIKLPDFRNSKYEGFSDHSIGITAAKVAVVKGAKYIEKHFTLSHSLQTSNERGHLGGMDLEQLRELRNFCDEFVLMP